VFPDGDLMCCIGLSVLCGIVKTKYVDPIDTKYAEIGHSCMFA